ncbi:Endoglin antigen, partial [Schistosoma japonicum]
SCSSIGDSFCIKHVPNSFCLTEKNECFCKYGYYSIQEDDGIMCKTLLTNHKCQLDSDCLYVINSICHPGAGACICPSGTIYVPEEQACRFQIKTLTNDFCSTCQRFHGQCYRNEDDWNRMYNLSSRSIERIHYGCKCPYNTVTINTNLLRSTSYNNQPDILVSTNSTQILNNTNLLAKTNKQQISGFCQGLLVDIGMFCNQVDMLCRSSNSFCSSGKLINKLYISPQCVCRHGHLPIYQQFLGYHECVPICDKCNPMEQYSRQQHCACPDIIQPNKHHKLYDMNENIKGNMLRLIGIKQNFTICFNPSMESLAFNLMNNDSTHLIVFMSNHPGSKYPHDNCILSIYEEERIWCSYKYISIEQCSISKPSLHSVFNEVIILRKNCLLHSSESSKEIKFYSNHLSTYGNFNILLNNDLSISNMWELFKNATGNNSFHFNSKYMGFFPDRNFTIRSELQITCIFRVCQHFRWCQWPSYCSDLTKWLNHDLPNSYLSENSLYPAMHILTRSLKIKVSEYNPNSSSDSSSTFVQIKNINSNRKPDAICITLSKPFAIFIICLVSGIGFTIVLHNHLNSVTCPSSYSSYCPPFHQLNKPLNHKNYNKNELSNNKLTTYSLYINPIKKKTLQFTHDNHENCRHQSSSLNIQYNPINNNDINKAQYPQSYQCSQSTYIQPYICTYSSEIIKNKVNNSYQNNMMKTSIQYYENDTTWNKIIPICCETHTNLNISECEHCLSRSINEEMYQDHIHQLEFNKTCKKKSSTSSTFCQQQIHSIPHCLHNQIFHCLPCDWTNDTKYDNTFMPISSIEYSRYNNNLFLNDNEHIEQEFNIEK